MFSFFKKSSCKKCEAYADEVKHLRGLVSQLMEQIAPKKEEILDPELDDIPRDDRERIQYGEG